MRVPLVPFPSTASAIVRRSWTNASISRSRAASSIARRIEDGCTVAAGKPWPGEETAENAAAGEIEDSGFWTVDRARDFDWGD